MPEKPRPAKNGASCPPPANRPLPAGCHCQALSTSERSMVMRGACADFQKCHTGMETIAPCLLKGG